MPTLADQVRRRAHVYVAHGGKSNRRQQVDHLPGVGRHLQGHGVAGAKLAGQPRLQVNVLDPARAVDRVLVAVDAVGHQVVLVDIQADVADDGNRSSGHGTPPTNGQATCLPQT